MSPTIALGGDVMLGRGVASGLAGRQAADVWSPELRGVLGEADIALVNVECCLGTNLRLEAGRLILSLSDADG